MNSIQIYQYKGFDIQFELIDGNIMANATLMCKAFDTDFSQYIRTKKAKSYIQFISAKMQVSENELVIVRQGSPENGGGSWIHQKLVLDLARWLSDEFAYWCDDRMAELLRTGQVAIKEISRKEMAKMIWEAEEAKEQLALENQQLKTQQQLNQPKVEFYEAVTDSKDATDLGTVAKLLHIRGVGRTKLFAVLRAEGILMKNNRPYQEYVDRGWFRVIESSWTKPNGSQHVYFKTVAFQRGIDGIRQLLQKTTAITPVRRLSTTTKALPQ